jgi:hypothetical protein
MSEEEDRDTLGRAVRRGWSIVLLLVGVGGWTLVVVEFLMRILDCRDVDGWGYVCCLD